MILAIDPGTTKSAYVLYDYKLNTLIGFGIFENQDMIQYLSNIHDVHGSVYLAIEMVKNYGMPIGDTLLMTCVWIGRFIQAWGNDDYTLIPRKTICSHICGSAKAKDSNIRQGLINRFGGSKKIAVGTKKAPGPLYGVTKDIWSALAVAITYDEMQEDIFD